MRPDQPSSLTSATVSPTMPAAMSQNCRYSRASKSPISAWTKLMSVFSSARTSAIFVWTLALDSAM